MSILFETLLFGVSLTQTELIQLSHTYPEIRQHLRREHTQEATSSQVSLPRTGGGNGLRAGVWPYTPRPSRGTRSRFAESSPCLAASELQALSFTHTTEKPGRQWVLLPPPPHCLGRLRPQIAKPGRVCRGHFCWQSILLEHFYLSPRIATNQNITVCSAPHPGPQTQPAPAGSLGSWVLGLCSRPPSCRASRGPGAPVAPPCGQTLDLGQGQPFG